MTKHYASMRIRNDRGGHDFTADGWDEMVRLLREQLAASELCAKLLREKGRYSVDFRAARQTWNTNAQAMLELSGAGELFDVGIRPKITH